MDDAIAAGWYPDPDDAAQQRYWDGTSWTEHRAPAAPEWDVPAPPTGPAWGGAPGTHGTYGATALQGSDRPDPWLWQSILATVLCCLPVGVVAIVMAAQSQGAATRGDLAEAHARAKSARTWTLAAIGLGVVPLVIGLALVTGMGVSGGGF